MDAKLLFFVAVMILFVETSVQESDVEIDVVNITPPSTPKEDDSWVDRVYSATTEVVDHFGKRDFRRCSLRFEDKKSTSDANRWLDRIAMCAEKSEEVKKRIVQTGRATGKNCKGYNISRTATNDGKRMILDILKEMTFDQKENLANKTTPEEYQKMRQRIESNNRRKTNRNMKAQTRRQDPTMKESPEQRAKRIAWGRRYYRDNVGMFQQKAKIRYMRNQGEMCMKSREKYWANRDKILEMRKQKKAGKKRQKTKRRGSKRRARVQRS